MDRVAWTDVSTAAGPARGFEHALRRLGTGFLFAVFGVGAVAIACVAVPLLGARKRGVARELAAQRMLHRGARVFVALGTVLRLFEVRERGTDRLAASPGLVVANHPTLLDVVFLLSRMPQADCIVKTEAWRNPFLRSVVRGAGYIPNAGGFAVIDACVERLRAGRTVVIFPEGTRSPRGGLGPFKRGAAHVALRGAGSITPVLVTCEPSALRKGQPWWDVPDRRLVYGLDVGPPMRVEDLVPAAGELPPARAARAISTALRRYFEAKVLDARD